MDETLPGVFSHIWEALAAATEGSGRCPAWRNMILGTTAPSGAPDLRILVLRKVDADALVLMVHTDTRSSKWTQITDQPRLALLGYDPDSREQIRLSGQAVLHGPDTAEQQRAWDALPAWTRTTYCGGPPGHVTSDPRPTRVSETPPSQSETAQGRAVFGVISVHISSMDWYKHPRGDIRRAVLTCAPETGMKSGQWVAP